MNKKEILGLCEFLKLHGYENADNISKSIFELQQENKTLKENAENNDKVIDKAINDIDLVIELIKQQPTEDDSWILDRLNAFKIILKEVK